MAKRGIHCIRGVLIMIRERVMRLAAVGCATLAMGCVGEKGVLSIGIPASSALGRVVLSPHNAIVAVGGTLQATTSGTSLDGTPITQFDSAQYLLATATDSARATVTLNGLVTAVRPSSTPVPVNVLVYLNGTVQVDQMLIQTTATTIPGITLSIQPPPGDSAKLASGTVKTIVPVLQNVTTGLSVVGPQLEYEVKVADESRLGVYTANITLPSFLTLRVGRTSLTPSVGRNQIVPYVSSGAAWVYARVNAYGTVLQDSVLYTFSYPYVGTVATSKSSLAVMTTINGGSALQPGLSATVTLTPGAIITFSSGLSATDLLTIAYTFDNPTAATAPVVSPSTTGGASGNVTALVGGQNSRRQFLTPGTYHWTTLAAGGPAPWPGQTFNGTIVIK